MSGHVTLPVKLQLLIISVRVNAKVLLVLKTHLLLLSPLLTLPLAILASLLFLEYVRYTLPSRILSRLFTVTETFPYQVFSWNLFSVGHWSNNPFLMQCTLTTLFKIVLIPFLGTFILPCSFFFTTVYLLGLS